MSLTAGLIPGHWSYMSFCPEKICASFMGVDQIWRVNNLARDENEVAKHMCAKAEGKHLLNKGELMLQIM